MGEDKARGLCFCISSLCWMYAFTGPGGTSPRMVYAHGPPAEAGRGCQVCPGVVAEGGRSVRCTHPLKGTLQYWAQALVSPKNPKCATLLSPLGFQTKGQASNEGKAERAARCKRGLLYRLGLELLITKRCFCLALPSSPDLGFVLIVNGDCESLRSVPRAVLNTQIREK